MATNDVLQIHIPSGRWYNKKTGNVIYSTPSDDEDDDYQPIYVCGSCYTTHNKKTSLECKKICTIKSQKPNYDGYNIRVVRNNDDFVNIENDCYDYNIYDTLSSVINNYLIERQVNKTLKKELLYTRYLLYHYDMTIYTSKIPSDILHLIMNYVYHN